MDVEFLSHPDSDFFNKTNYYNPAQLMHVYPRKCFPMHFIY
jgi:hypothetical protein